MYAGAKVRSKADKDCAYVFVFLMHEPIHGERFKFEFFKSVDSDQNMYPQSLIYIYTVAILLE